jgi:DNA-binding CsgD family transcriptional regulator
LAAAARRHGVRHTPLVPGADPAGPTVLSRREREVLRLVGQGLSTRLIAARLGISATTVDTHVRSAVVKLGAGNRRQAAAQLA